MDLTQTHTHTFMNTNTNETPYGDFLTRSDRGKENKICRDYLFGVKNKV